LDKQLYKVILSAAALVFLIGVAAGALLAYRMDTGADSEINGLLSSYALHLQQGTASGTPLWQSLLNSYLFPVLAFLSGFTLLGVAAIPILLILRGFILAFVFTSFVSVFGINGIWLALGELGIQCFLSVPCLIILSIYSANTALRLLSMARGRVGGSPLFPRRLFIRFGICTAVLAICAVADTYLSPLLRGWISSRVF
jgi:stage II sporulation protein M